MDYKDFLGMCYVASVKTHGFGQLGERFKNNELVVYNEKTYIPMKVIVWYDKYGNEQISAEIREVDKNSCLIVPMEKVNQK